jgi:hypothetical protein
MFDFIGGIKSLSHKIGQGVHDALGYSRKRGIGSATQALGAGLQLGGLALAGSGILAPVGAAMGVAGLGLAGVGTALKGAETISDDSLSAGQKIGKVALDTALGVGVLKSAQIGKAVGGAIRNVGLKGLTKYQYAIRPADGMFSGQHAQNIRNVAQGIKTTAKVAEEVGAHGKTLAKTAVIARDFTRRFN